MGGTGFEPVAPTMSRSSRNAQSDILQILTRTYEDRQVRTKTEQNGIYRQVSAKPYGRHCLSVGHSSFHLKSAYTQKENEFLETKPNAFGPNAAIRQCPKRLPSYICMPKKLSSLAR